MDSVIQAPFIIDTLIDIAQPWYGSGTAPEDWVFDNEEDMYLVYRGWPNDGDENIDQIIIAFSDDPSEPSVQVDISGGDLARKSEGEIVTVSCQIAIFNGDSSNEGLQYVAHKGFSLLYLFHTRLKGNSRLKSADHPDGLAMRAWIEQVESTSYPAMEGAMALLDFDVRVQTNTRHLNG